MMKLRVMCPGLALAVTVCLNSGQAGDLNQSISILRTAKPGGVGSAACQQAIAEIAAEGSAALIPVLNGFQDASPLAANWLRNAWDESASRVHASGGKLPAKELESFILDTRHSPIARRLAYESLRAQDESVEARLIPGLLLDPSPEFRRDAVARLVAEAASAPEGSASQLYRKALQGAVHEDQVATIAEALRKAGETVDIQQHFGFLTDWTLVGPFDNKDEKGFAVAYPLEQDLASGQPLNTTVEYDGQLGKAVWKQLHTDDDYGTIDIAKQIENYKGSLMYATAVWNSPSRQSLEIRLGTPNAWKLWINGKLVFEREEYHRSSQMDQYRVPVDLNAGPNVLVLKVCQNEMTQDWAQRYQFQLRICDSTGAGVQPAAGSAKSASVSGELR